MLYHHPIARKKLLNEAPGEIDQTDVNEIRGAGEEEQYPAEDTVDSETNPTAEGDSAEEGPDTSGEEGGEDVTEDDEGDPNVTDDPASGGMDAPDANQPSLVDDETRKLQLLKLFIQLKDIVCNNIEVIKKLPFINSKNYTETVTFVERDLAKLLNNINYLIAYKYSNISYLNARKIFLNFKLNILQIVRIVNLLAAYSKDNEIASMAQIRKHKEKINSISRIFDSPIKKKS